MLAKLVVALDGSTCAAHAFEFALALARTEGSKLAFCSVAGAVPALAQVESETNAIVGEAMATASAAGVAAEACRERGEPAHGIVACAEAMQADGIVMGTHGRSGVNRLLVGSVAEGVLRLATVPVFTVREEAAIAPLGRGLLVPVDGSECSLKALDAAIELATSLDAAVTVCHVVDLAKAGLLSGGQPQLIPESIEILDAEGRRVLADATERAVSVVKLSSRSVQGMPVDEIEHLAGELRPALIVMGSHGRTGLERVVLGSVAEGVVRRAPVPVMIVPLPRAHSGREIAGMT